MSLKLDELRKRLLQQSHNESANAPSRTPPARGTSLQETPLGLKIAGAAVVEPAPEDAPDSAAAPENAESHAEFDMPQPENGSVVVMEITPDAPEPKGLVQERAEIRQAETQLDEAVVKVFEQTRVFEERIKELQKMFGAVEQIEASATSVFEPLRSFHDQLTELSQSFQSIRAFQAQLAELGKNFEPMKVLHDQLGQLIDSFQGHLTQLVDVLQPAKEFRDRVARLAEALDPAAQLQEEFGQLCNAFRLASFEGNENGNGGRAASQVTS
jgi:DNA repair exonuclease SbcCD ATPase subunit